MARTALSVQEIAVAGITPSYEAANADGEKISNDGKTFIQVKNTNAGEITVTVVTPITIGGLAVSDRTITVPATTGDKMIGPFKAAHYDQLSGDDEGFVYVNFSAVTDVTIAAFRVG